MNIRGKGGEEEEIWEETHYSGQQVRRSEVAAVVRLVEAGCDRVNERSDDGAAERKRKDQSRTR